MQSEVIDEPLRRDHAAEIAGRNLEGVQTPKDPVERVRERIPQHETENEKLVPHMQVNQPGPDLEQLNAARREIGIAEVEAPKDGGKRTAEEEAELNEAAAQQKREDTASRNRARDAAPPADAEAPVTNVESAPTGVEAPAADVTRADKARRETKDERSRATIPSDWQDLSANEKRALAAQLTDKPVKNKADAEAVIEAEVARRGQ
jgi:hypothetical protein